MIVLLSLFFAYAFSLSVDNNVFKQYFDYFYHTVDLSKSEALTQANMSIKSGMNLEEFKTHFNYFYIAVDLSKSEALTQANMSIKSGMNLEKFKTHFRYFYYTIDLSKPEALTQANMSIKSGMNLEKFKTHYHYFYHTVDLSKSEALTQANTSIKSGMNLEEFKTYYHYFYFTVDLSKSEAIKQATEKATNGVFDNEVEDNMFVYHGYQDNNNEVEDNEVEDNMFVYHGYQDNKNEVEDDQDIVVNNEYQGSNYISYNDDSTELRWNSQDIDEIGNKSTGSRIIGNTTKTTNNLPLILGITIPLAFIIIVAIIVGVVLCNRKKKAQAPVIAQPINYSNPSPDAALAPQEDQIAVLVPYSAQPETAQPVNCATYL